MAAPQMHDHYGPRALNVLALPAAEGWLYFAEVVERRPDRVMRVRAVTDTAYPSAVSALAQGMAYARVVASRISP